MNGISGALWPSLVRTGVPYVVGLLLSLPFAGPILDALSVDDHAARLWLTKAVAFVFAFAYYLAARLLERRWPTGPWGYLLGSPAIPIYGKVQADGSTLIAAPQLDAAKHAVQSTITLPGVTNSSVVETQAMLTQLSQTQAVLARHAALAQSSMGMAEVQSLSAADILGGDENVYAPDPPDSPADSKE